MIRGAVFAVAVAALAALAHAQVGTRKDVSNGPRWEPLESRQYRNEGSWSEPNLEYVESKRTAPKKEKEEAPKAEPEPKPAPKHKAKKEEAKQPVKKVEKVEPKAKKLDVDSKVDKVLEDVAAASTTAEKLRAAKKGAAAIAKMKVLAGADEEKKAERDAREKAMSEVDRANEAVKESVAKADAELKKQFEGIPKDMLPETPVAQQVAAEKLKEVMGDAKVPEAADMQKMFMTETQKLAAGASGQ